PYVQIKLCLNEKALFIRMLAFEVKVMPESCVAAAFAFDGSNKILVVRSTNTAATAYSLDTQTTEETPFVHEAHFFGGEDLQGIYWGVDITLPKENLQDKFPTAQLYKGGKLKGNFYKTCTEPPFVHMGSLFPCDFTNKDFISPEAMAEFEIVDY
ncbi:MAG: hypothetical protein RR263_04355, partial [Oscillospiraceae bacterium]